MHWWKYLIGFNVIIGLFLNAESSEGAVMYRWNFDDPAGTKLPETAHIGKEDVTWSTNFDDSETSGEGAYRLRRPVGGPPNAYVDIQDVTQGIVYLRIDVAGWLFTGRSASETLRIGFSNSDPDGTRPQVTAQIQLERISKTDVALGGEAFFSGGPSSHIPQKILFSNFQKSPVNLVLKLDKDANKYEIFYRRGEEDFTSLGESNIDPERYGKYIRFGAYGSFQSTSSEYLDIGTILLTDDEKAAFGE